MRPHGIRLINRYAVFIAIVVAFSCDTFQEDFISDENKVVFGKTEFYTKPGVSVRILLDSLITRSFINATLKITKDPTKGELTQTDGDTLLYIPDQSFTFGEDKFVISVQRGEETLKNQTITIFMPPVDFVRTWATYYGGQNYDYGYSMTVDVRGNIYVVGATLSTSGIGTFGSFQDVLGGADYDAFLTKFNAEGVRQWSTYYGGSRTETGRSVAVDAEGNVYLAGETQSPYNITTQGSHQDVHGGANDVFWDSDLFLVKFNTDGVRQWATYYGGMSGEAHGSVALDSEGNVYLAGTTYSQSGIATPGSHQNVRGGEYSECDAFLVKLNADGERQWATYYGGSNRDYGLSTAVDASGNIYLAGLTNSTTSIASNGHQNAYAGGYNDAFLVKFNTNGVRQWATYYGGSGDEGGAEYDWFALASAAVDVSGNVYLAGMTNSSSGISSRGHQDAYGGGHNDAFLVKFNTNGLRQWATYYGGSRDDLGFSMASDLDGNIYLAGTTSSSSGIAVSSSQQNTYGGGESYPSSFLGGGDAFLVRFNTDGIRQWATYYGGSKYEEGYSTFADAIGNAYLLGETRSTSGIATSGSHQNTFGGEDYYGGDTFLVKFIRK